MHIGNYNVCNERHYNVLEEVQRQTSSWNHTFFENIDTSMTKNFFEKYLGGHDWIDTIEVDNLI